MILDKRKVLFDTNVVIDIFAKRINQEIIDLFYLIFDSEKYNFYIVSKQITDIYYILRKYEPNNNKRLNLIKEVLDVFNMLNFTNKDVYKGMKLDGKDFEDNVLIATALKNKMDYIVSNNKKDFDFCDDITAIDLTEFINLFYNNKTI